MSITLGIYDLFSYAIPGILYIFLFHEVLRLLRLPPVPILQWDSNFVLVVLGLLAYLVGLLFNNISHYLWYRRFYPGKSEERAFSRFKTSSGLKTDFDPHQWSILLSVIRHDNMEVCNTIDKNKATSIMLRNVSFAMFLFTIVFLISAFVPRFSPPFLLSAVATAIGSFVALHQGDEFNQWFYMLIYQQSLVYGNSLIEVLDYNKIKATADDQAVGRLGKKR